MAEPLKYIYNDQFFESYVKDMKAVYDLFDEVQFYKDIYRDDWDTKELKQRMSHLAMITYEQLPDSFEESCQVIIKFYQHLFKNGISQTFEHMFIPEIIEKNGLDHFDISMNTMKEINKYTSCEFAIRVFIIKYEDQVIKQLLDWSNHPNENVRRFASEACRPRLPWALGIAYLKKDPTTIIPILENLKNDPTVYVQKSVANNLNDISKDHPELVIKLAQKWFGQLKSTDWIIKHACRTLLKQGNQNIMPLFGYGTIENIDLLNFKTTNPLVRLGEYLDFSFDIKNNAKTSNKLRLEYGIYYLRSNGTHHRKVFKISELAYEGNTSKSINRKQSFRPITTRKFIEGTHRLSIIINGIEKGILDFEFINE